MRLFIGSFAKIEEYEAFLEPVKSLFGGAFASEKSLHLTYLFLGEKSESERDEIVDFLSEFDFKGAKINSCRLSIFGHPPKAVVIELDCNVYQEIHSTLKERFGGDDKPYRPHITLLRIKTIKESAYKEKLKDVVLPKIEVDSSISLIKSTPSQGGAMYETLFTKEKSVED